MEAVLADAPASPPVKLSSVDRCDGSSAEQAQVLLKHPTEDYTLQLCRHHYAKSAEKLLTWTILVDDRPRNLGVDE